MQKIVWCSFPALLMLTTALTININFIRSHTFLNIQTYKPVADSPNPIRLNQLGFYPRAPKMAIVTGNNSYSEFYVLSGNQEDTVYRGKLSAGRQSSNSSTVTRVADFSAVTSNGKFLLYVPGVGRSYPFVIGEGANRAASVACLKGYYFQRVSMPLEPAFAGKWSRPAGHPDTFVLIHPSAATPLRQTGKAVSTPGGWYDAGDYNKYIVNSGITMGTLLSAYEDFPVYFKKLSTSIPETGNQIPDILNETIYNLRWMLTMQDPDDGGVYNKCTNAAFDGMVMPGVTKAPRFVVAKGTAATLDFAAVMAQSSRILKKFDKQLPGLADSCIKAALKAWSWALQNPALAYDQNTINKTTAPQITTGGYGDRKFDDEWFWAAAELLVTTKDNQYRSVVLAKFTDMMSLPSWNNVQMLGNYSLIRSEKVLAKDMFATIIRIKRALIHFASDYESHLSDNAFQTVMGASKNEFNWGSNSNAANQGIVLIYGFLLTKDKTLLDAALSNLDYILGRNATGYCFVTGLGSFATMHPHHRQSVADGIGEPVPGLLAGGPNPGMQDKCHYDFTEPETAYSDTDCSYASNEIAINWNAPLVYLAGAIEALQKKL